MRLFQSFAAIAVVAALPMTLALAQNPANGVRKPKPIVEIVEQFEKAGYGPFIELSVDDGYWEVEVYEKNVSYELTVDRHTGEILSKHRDEAEPRPPHNAQPLSQILRKLIKNGNSHIDDISFERRYWEIEVLRDGREHELLVHPTTGELVSDRLDD